MPNTKRSTEDMDRMTRKGSVREDSSKSAPTTGKASKKPESSGSKKSR